MSLSGLALCARYSYPPNSLSLCGPTIKSKQIDLKWYSTNQRVDKGTWEILSQFSTLYPYLKLIAYKNDIKDPFDKRVVEAYWLGNNLLHQISIKDYVKHFFETLKIRRNMKRNNLELLLGKTASGALPHHSFHVLNVYQRTGHPKIPHTLETMEACLINWGKIEEILPASIIVTTKPLKLVNNQLVFGKSLCREILTHGDKDFILKSLKKGDWISYHWGYLCQKLTEESLKNLIHYTKLSLSLASSNL